MKIYESIDPFVMAIIILPTIVIGVGVLIAVFTRKLLMGALGTLILNMLYELWYSKTYYPDSEPNLTSWNVVLPAITIVISFLLMRLEKRRIKGTFQSE